MGGVDLEYRIPAAEIADFVTLFYFFRSDLPHFEDMERADHAQMRFRLDDSVAEYRFADGAVQQATGVHVVGPSSAAYRISVEGPVRLFGWGMTAAGWTAIIGGEASNALNRMIDAPPLLGPRITQAYNSMRGIGDIDALTAIATALIEDLVRDSCREMLRFARIVDTWLEESLTPDIDDLIVATGLSRRQIERKCNAMYGAPPKLLSRKFRALRVAVAMRDQDVSFNDVVGQGFYDQSHLIREVKQFTGLTPRQIRDEPTLLTHLTVVKRAELGGLVKSIISDT